ncbi:MAG TPA: glycosyltransferase [Terracidiphilus sp.]|jgi:glycosyltransferase involved in cell wall biosynthesis
MAEPCNGDQRDECSVIVVPCYNEELRLPVSSYRAFLMQRPSVKLLFVNDGSTDATQIVLERMRAEFPLAVEVLSLERNRGKAEAVRRGLKQASSMNGVAFTGFWDADLATPLDELTRLIQLLSQRSAVDMILGSRVRLLGRSIERRPLRHYFGRVFATLASLTLELPVYDTQCGAKIFRITPTLLQIFDTPFQSPWTFDVEILARYRQIRGAEARSGIYEEPLRVWRDVDGSKVTSWDALKALADLIQIRRRYGKWSPVPR